MVIITSGYRELPCIVFKKPKSGKLTLLEEGKTKSVQVRRDMEEKNLGGISQMTLLPIKTALLVTTG